MEEKQPPSMLSNGLPPPPVPKRLREMLKNYPRHLELIQKDLSELIADHAKSIPIFEQAVWALEGRTSAFIREAQIELEQVQASGDAQAIARAEAKEDLMFSARSSNDGLNGLHELWDYFQAHADDLK